MVSESSNSLIAVGSTLLGISLGALLQYVGSTAQVKRQEAERVRSMLREKLEDLSMTIEDFRDGAQVGLTDILEFSLTGRLREGQIGMKKLPRLEMLVRFYAPSLTPDLEALRKAWTNYGEAVAVVISARERRAAATKIALVPAVAYSEEISRHCDALQSGLVALLHGTLFSNRSSPA